MEQRELGVKSLRNRRIRLLPNSVHQSMQHFRTILTCLAIASLLVSDVVVAVHSASCSQLTQSASSELLQPSDQRTSDQKTCSCHKHGCTSTEATHEGSTPAPEHDCDQCTICRGALVSRFAVICDTVLPPAFEALEDWVTVAAVTLSLGQEFSSALSERGPPV